MLGSGAIFGGRGVPAKAQQLVHVTSMAWPTLMPMLPLARGGEEKSYERRGSETTRVNGWCNLGLVR